MPTAPDYLTSPTRHLLLRMSASNGVSILAAASFGLVDTFFIGQLGTEALTAINFTHPLTLFLLSYILGIGIALSSLLARAIGEKKKTQLTALFQHSALFTLISTSLIAFIFYSITPLLISWFHLPEKTLQLAKDYLSLWYLAFPIFGLMRLNQQALKSFGFVKSNAIIISSSALLNIMLDPLLIFGVGSWEGLGIQGASFASLIAWLASFLLSIIILKKKVATLFLKQTFHISALKQSLLRIYTIAAPSALTLTMTPIMNSSLLILLARTNVEAMTAFGTGLQIQSFCLVGAIALSHTLVPFLAQNLGANQEKRAYEGLYQSYRILLTGYLILFVILHYNCAWIAALFTSNEHVLIWLTLYLKWMPLSFAPLSIMIVYANALNAYQKPLFSVAINIVRSFVLALPMALIGQQLFQESGIFYAALIANLIMGIVCFYLSKELSPKENRKVVTIS